MTENKAKDFGRKAKKYCQKTKRNSHIKIKKQRKQTKHQLNISKETKKHQRLNRNNNIETEKR